MDNKDEEFRRRVDNSLRNALLVAGLTGSSSGYPRPEDLPRELEMLPREKRILFLKTLLEHLKADRAIP
jgi:hypothetical protein